MPELISHQFITHYMRQADLKRTILTLHPLPQEHETCDQCKVISKFIVNLLIMFETRMNTLFVIEAKVVFSY